MISFVVPGTPQPQGSMKAFVPKGWNRPVLTSDNSKLKTWRWNVGQMAKQAMMAIGEKLISKPLPIRVEAQFYFAKPKGSKERHKVTRPDLDKICRALLDSLTGIAFEDDSQVTQLWVSKFFGSQAHTQVRITELSE
jgi:crossover junction endodeoxyribonuclease RusA